MRNKAVILGTNDYISLSVIRCLGIEGIYTVAVDYLNKRQYVFKSKYCSQRLIAPNPGEGKEEFVRFLKEFGKKQALPPVLIVCNDYYVKVVDKYLDKLKKFYLIAQEESGLHSRLINKKSLREIATERGLLMPEVVAMGESNLYERVEEKIGYPCIVKPIDLPAFIRRFKKRSIKARNQDQLRTILKVAESAGLEVIIERIIPGFDNNIYTLDAYLNRESKITHWMTAQKHRQYPINFGFSVYTEQKYVPELYHIGKEFLENINYKGFVEMEFKKDVLTGQYYLIKINTRITSFNSLIYKLGINIPYITYMDMLGRPLPAKAIQGDSNCAFWYLYGDILAIIDYLKSKQLSAKEIIQSLWKSKAYAIWSLDDPRPALEFLKIKLEDILKRISY